MSDHKEAETPDVEENPADVEAPSTSEAEPAEHSSPKKHSNKLPLFLLFITLLAAGYIFAPKQLKSELFNLAETLLQKEMGQVSQKPVTPVPTSAPVVTEPELATVAPEPVKPAIEVSKTPEPVVISASSDEVNRMLSAMSQLQNELKSLRQQQRLLEETQHSVQNMQLRARLGWITNPANHLAQIQLAWEEISLMPMLSSDERQQAQTMLALAEKSLRELQSWQQILQTQADSLTTKEHDNIVPSFESRWLNWIAEQFSIRPSLSQEEAQNAQLREQLLNISRNIEMEQWPDAKTWLQLHATLQLRMVTSASDASAAPKLELPESFDAIRHDIDQLRQTATTWMERLP